MAAKVVSAAKAHGITVLIGGTITITMDLMDAILKRKMVAANLIRKIVANLLVANVPILVHATRKGAAVLVICM
jgi:hypothetical protein